jgi:mannosyltransferase OCH1-like enzyme
MKTLEDTEFFRLTRFRDGFTGKVESPEVWERFAEGFARWHTLDRPPRASIPKILHQIWIGKEMPERNRVMCSSWTRLNPEFEYRLWDDGAIRGLGDFEARGAYDRARSLGTKSDIARYEILRRFGGIYVDTDFECVKPIAELADACELIVGNLYSEMPQITNSLIGVRPGHWLMSLLCARTANAKSSTEPMEVLESTGPFLITRSIIENFQSLGDYDIVFPSSYFYPLHNYQKYMDPSEVKAKYVTDRTYGIHYWDISWAKLGLRDRLVRKVRRAFQRIVGTLAES